MSSTKYPMLAQVIPCMDLLFRKLELKVADEELPLTVRRGIQRALMVLDKYYALVDDSIMWKTSMRAFFRPFVFIIR